MRTVFADSGYWIALLNPRDALHATAHRLSRSLESGGAHFVTGELVFIELLNYYAGFGTIYRSSAARLIRGAGISGITIIPHSSARFDAALSLYETRPDKEWSLVDCSSILIMQELGITEALAHDRHFEQAGFHTLLR